MLPDPVVVALVTMSEELPGRWCQGAWTKVDPDGREWHCLDGFIRAFTPWDALGRHTLRALVERACAIDYVVYNDEPGRTADEMGKLCLEAAYLRMQDLA